jgi:DNA-directed RNA polymerase subunit H (RpoH/RPB5)
VHASTTAATWRSAPTTQRSWQSGFHANEKNYDDVPSVAKAAAISGKRLVNSISIEFFYASELQFNRLAHEEIPEHIPLDFLVDNEQFKSELERDDRKGWLIALREPHSLPVIRRDEIIARIIGVQTGQVVRTETKDKEQGGTLFEYQQIV